MCDAEECCNDITFTNKLTTKQFKCFKCKTADAIVGGREKACKICFLSNMENNFKSTLRSHLNIQRESKIAIAMGLDVASCVLESLIECAMRGKNPRIHTHQNISFIHVDIRSEFPELFQSSNLKIDEGLEYLRNLADKRNCDLHVIPLATSFPANLRLQIIEQLKSLPIESAARYLHLIRNRDILYKAEELQVSDLVFASTADVLAIRSVKLACQGGGIHMASECSSFSDSHIPSASVRIVRPFHAFFAKDVSLYLHYKGLEQPPLDFKPFDMPDAGQVKGSGNRSVDSLCTDFLLSLQKDQGATSQVVVRTVAKVSPLRIPAIITEQDLTDQLLVAENSKCINIATSNAMIPAALLKSMNQLQREMENDPDRCCLCKGRRESNAALKCRWSVKQKSVLNSSLILKNGTCLACARLVASSEKSRNLALILADVSVWRK